MSVVGKDAVPEPRRIIRLPQFSWSWLSIPSLLIVWMLVATQFESYVLPQVWEVAEEAYEWMADGSLWQHLWASFL